MGGAFEVPRKCILLVTSSNLLENNQPGQIEEILMISNRTHFRKDEPDCSASLLSNWISALGRFSTG